MIHVFLLSLCSSSTGATTVNYSSEVFCGEVGLEGGVDFYNI